MNKYLLSLFIVVFGCASPKNPIAPPIPSETILVVVTAKNSEVGSTFIYDQEQIERILLVLSQVKEQKPPFMHQSTSYAEIPNSIHFSLIGKNKDDEFYYFEPPHLRNMDGIWKLTDTEIQELNKLLIPTKLKY